MLMIIFLILFVFLFVSLLIYTSLRNKKFSDKLNAYASSKGWQTETASPLVPAMQAQGYHSNKSIIEGTINGLRFWLYVCQPATVRTNFEQSSQTAIILLSVEMPITFTDLLLAPSAGALNIVQDEVAEHAFGLHPLTLEGDFSQHFHLYTKTGSQVETLELFTPDVMADFELSIKTAVLFSGNYVSIWSSLPVQTIDSLNVLLKDAELVVTKIQNKAQYKLANAPS